MLQHIKTGKKSISKFHFPVKLYEIRKNVIIQYYFLHKNLQIWIVTCLHKMHIFLSNLKKTIENPKFNFLTIICEIWKKCKNTKLFVFLKRSKILSNTVSNKTYIFFSIPKNTIKIQKFHFLDKICEIQKKGLDGKLFA